MSMQTVLICCAFFVLIPGASPNGEGYLARASGEDQQGAKRGEALYNASCVVCHGAQAIGGIGPRLAGNPVLSNEQGFWKIVSEGRHVMPPLKDAVTKRQMADIQAWLKTLP
ncbi:MAG: cytochrome c [Nitrospirota bacterium]|nr:cytochrome c [Nitrospirota bacterium]